MLFARSLDQLAGAVNPHATEERPSLHALTRGLDRVKEDVKAIKKAVVISLVPSVAPSETPSKRETSTHATPNLLPEPGTPLGPNGANTLPPLPEAVKVPPA